MRKKERVRISIAAAAAATVLLSVGAVVVFAWTVDETHFDRPDPDFSALAAELATVDGVINVQHERWVEAPTFSDPSAAIHVTLTDAALPIVQNIACARDYSDAVSWAFEVVTPANTRVAMFADAAPGCPDVGFEAASVVTEIDRLVPGEKVQAAMWEGTRFSVSALEDITAGMSASLALVENADALRASAGVDPDTVVEVGSSLLGVEIGPGEAAGYHALLSRLVAEYDVTGLFTGGGTPIDGVEKVQVSAPATHHTDIVREIAASRLPIADLPVTFLPDISS